MKQALLNELVSLLGVVVIGAIIALVRWYRALKLAKEAGLLSSQCASYPGCVRFRRAPGAAPDRRRVMNHPGIRCEGKNWRGGGHHRCTCRATGRYRVTLADAVVEMNLCGRHAKSRRWHCVKIGEAA